MTEPINLATVAIHNVDCAPDCREKLTTMGRYGRYARAALDAVGHDKLRERAEKAERERDSLARRCALRYEETENLRAEVERLTAERDKLAVTLSLTEDERRWYRAEIEQTRPIVKAAKAWAAACGVPGASPVDLWGDETDKALLLAARELADATKTEGGTDG